MPMSFGGVSKAKVATIIVAADGSGDTTDIQIGINMLPVMGGVVYVKEGTYIFTSVLEIDSNNTSLKGAGASTYIRFIGAGFDDYLIDLTADQCSIEDIKLDTDVAFGRANVTPLRVVGDDNFLRGIWAVNYSQYGIRITGSGNIFVECNLSGGNHGFRLAGAEKNVINGNYINESLDAITLGADSINNVIINNVCDGGAGIGTDGILLMGGGDDGNDNNVMIGNRIINYEQGIVVSAGNTTNTIGFNNLIDCTLSGLVDAGTSTDAEHNTF